MTNPNQPPTPPAVTDEMVERAIGNYGMAVANNHNLARTDRVTETREALLALIARARTPETATPVPGRVTELAIEVQKYGGTGMVEALDELCALASPNARLHAAAQALLDDVDEFSSDCTTRYEVSGETLDDLRAALAAAPTPAATDAVLAVLREAVNAFTPCADCCDTPQWYDVVAAANPKAPPAPAPKPGPTAREALTSLREWALKFTHKDSWNVDVQYGVCDEIDRRIEALPPASPTPNAALAPDAQEKTK